VISAGEIVSVAAGTEEVYKIQKVGLVERADDSTGKEAVEEVSYHYPAHPVNMGIQR
jgi:hypothetical protein